MLEGIEAEINKEQKNKTKQERLSSIDKLLTDNGIDVSDIGKVENVKVWQGYYKDNDGVAQTVDMTGVTLSPKFADGPDWPVVQQAERQPIVWNQGKTPALLSNWKCAVFLPDPQIGYTQDVNGTYIPFHDVGAIRVAVNCLAALSANYKVDKVVNLGDYLDLPSMSKYIQEAGFALTAQKAIDEGHVFLALQRAVVPDAEIVIIEGNHDKRMQNFVVVNAKAAFGLKRAGSPGSWPVMSLPYLLRCDELSVEYIDAYPAGEYWINDNLRAIHGTNVVSGGSTAAKYVKDYPGISTIFGHVHRIEKHHQTKHDRKGPVRTLAASPGCLCRIDGAVPSVNGGTGANGAPALNWENWQQGIGWANYNDKGDFYYHDAQIIDGKTIIEGQEISG